MSASGLQLTGVREIMRNLERIAKQQERRIGPALARQAESILAESQEIVPVDTGVLRDSGRIEEPRGLGDTTRVSVVFGGPTVPYALVVHETPNSGGKYLERPLLAKSSSLLKDLAKALDVEKL